MSNLILYYVLICLPFLILPILKFARIITDKLFVMLYFLFVFVLYLEIVFNGSYISVSFIFLYVIINLIHRAIKSGEEKYTDAIILKSDDTNGKVILYDGFIIKELYCGFNKGYSAGKITRINSDFWKNI